MNQLDITDGQLTAAGHYALEGVVYAVSGMLPGRGVIPDALFYWATHSVTLGGQDYDQMISAPQGVERGQLFLPGQGQVQPPVVIPVRNLPFAHSVSLVAAVTDEDFAVEGATCSLMVAYLKRDQTAADLVAADFTHLVTEGFLAAPRDLQLDGLSLVIYNRGVKLGQILKLPRLPTEEGAYAIDERDAGIMAPIVVGAPDSWVKVPTLNLGVRGFTVSAYEAGVSGIDFRAITVGQERLLNGNGTTDAATAPMSEAAAVMIHYLTPIYDTVVSSATYDSETHIFSITLTSGLAASIPRGAYVQEFGPGRDNSDNSKAPGVTNAYSWVLAGAAAYGSNSSLVGHLGWLFPDGSIRPLDHSIWNAGMRIQQDIPGGTYLRSAVQVTLGRGARATPSAPVFFTPEASGVEVTQQPAFTTTSKERMTSKLNYPTGGTGSGYELAMDGNENTYATLATNDEISLTFNTAPAPFNDDDTTTSTLHVMVNGKVTFKNAAESITFGTADGGGGAVESFRFTQGSARDFNETVKCIGGIGGSGAGFVVEVWWEHDLEVDIALTRSADVIVADPSTVGVVGPKLEYAELVWRPHLDASGYLTFKVVSGDSQNINNPWLETASGGGAAYWVPYPTSVLPALHGMLFNGPTGAATSDGSITHLNRDSWDAAHAKFIAEDVRLNFVLQKEPPSWIALEQQIAAQCRCQIYYGPSGHEVHFLEAASGLEAQTPIREFRLPGCPGANTFVSSAPLLERTPASEVVNTVEGRWKLDYLQGGSEFMVVSSAESIGLVGIRKPTQGILDMTLHSATPQDTGYDAAASVSGILQFYADRQAFALTRAVFDTGWIAHGLDRGSIVRMTWPVADGHYRTGLAEVDSVKVAPLNAERFTVQARIIQGSVQKGLDAALIWADQYTADTDIWTDVVESIYDRWSTYWSAA